MNTDTGNKLQKKKRKSVPVHNIDIYEEMMCICIHPSPK